MKKFNSFRNRQNGFEDLGSGTAEAAKTKKSWWKVPGIILVILVIAIFTFNSTYQIREQEQAVLITLGQAKAVTDPKPVKRDALRSSRIKKAGRQPSEAAVAKRGVLYLFKEIGPVPRLF